MKCLTSGISSLTHVPLFLYKKFQITGINVNAIYIPKNEYRQTIFTTFRVNCHIYCGYFHSYIGVLKQVKNLLKS